VLLQIKMNIKQFYSVHGIDLKQRVTKTAPPRTKLALTRTAISALRSIQKQPERVEQYFGQEDVRYASA
jgi:hypothetical protein